ncbi:MAG: hypothetical protein JWR42_584, partial [Marmoricola sp.]|nr:hypothetical protein [Marmoricola sp.]
TAGVPEPMVFEEEPPIWELPPHPSVDA